ncbi:hypothetical protein I79_015692 [Cricetulus griseus]|uniref:Uncharacterized protein n=1 Tax=Cricetulus griseus TaxID=10029 RepID=G3HXG9_CRIGR|nr:hypothetical protein I79_015692 [Cricetulus griseus]
MTQPEDSFINILFLITYLPTILVVRRRSNIWILFGIRSTTYLGFSLCKAPFTRSSLGDAHLSHQNITFILDLRSQTGLKDSPQRNTCLCLICSQ